MRKVEVVHLTAIRAEIRLNKEYCTVWATGRHNDVVVQSFWGRVFHFSMASTITSYILIRMAHPSNFKHPAQNVLGDFRRRDNKLEEENVLNRMTLCGFTCTFTVCNNTNYIILFIFIFRILVFKNTIV